MRTLAVISTIGNAGVGKDTLLSLLKKEIEDQLGMALILQMNFADPLKEIAKIAFNLSTDQVSTQEGKASSPESCYGFTVRQLLQMIGTEMFRDMVSKTIWPDNLVRRVLEAYEFHFNHTAKGVAEDIPLVVLISDSRFYTEVDAIRSLSGKLVGITRETNPIKVDTTHQSEVELRDIINGDQQCDAIYANDGTLEDLKAFAHNQVKTWINEGFFHTEFQGVISVETETDRQERVRALVKKLVESGELDVVGENKGLKTSGFEPGLK